MADDKPKGLDLAKLLAKSRPVAEQVKNPPSVLPAAGQGPATDNGDIKLLILQPTEPKNTEPVHVRKSDVRPVAHSASRPVSKSATSVQNQALRPPSPKAPSRPIASAMRPTTNHSIEQAASRTGLVADRLNVVQQESRRYPRGALGVDEILLYSVTFGQNLNFGRAFLTDKTTPFTLELRIVGSSRESFVWSYDGHQFQPISADPAATHTATLTSDADLIIDKVRGKLSQKAWEMAEATKTTGRSELFRQLKIKKYYRIIDTETQQPLPCPPSDALHRELRQESRDAIDFLTKLIEKRVEPFVRWVEQPAIIRFICEIPSPVEVLFHFEKGQLNILRGKPGESLVQGTVDVRISEAGLNLLWDAECGFEMTMLCGQMSYFGDINIMNRLGMLDPGFVSGMNFWLERLEQMEIIWTHSLLPIPEKAMIHRFRHHFDAKNASQERTEKPR